MHFSPRFSHWFLLVGLMLFCSSCDRVGPSQTVLDWEIYLDVRTAQAIDRWVTGSRLDANTTNIPTERWLVGKPVLGEGSVPSTTVTGTVAEAPAPIATSPDMAIEKFPDPMTLIIRDPTNGSEWIRRELSPGYNTFKTFLDAPNAGQACILYHGKYFIVTPLTFNRGRHQAVTVTVTTDRGQVPNIR